MNTLLFFVVFLTGFAILAVVVMSFGKNDKKTFSGVYEKKYRIRQKNKEEFYIEQQVYPLTDWERVKDPNSYWRDWEFKTLEECLDAAQKLARDERARVVKLSNENVQKSVYDEVEPYYIDIDVIDGTE